MKAERSNYFDAEFTQKILPGLHIGIDAYYKRATNEGDVGQFGAPQYGLRRTILAGITQRF